jgi:Domain of unknown function (DUF4132)
LVASINEYTFQPNVQQAWFEIINFVENENADLPLYSGSWENYPIDMFVDCLDLSEWSDFDQRIFEVLLVALKNNKGGGSWYRITNETFHRIAEKTLYKNDSEVTLKFILELYETQGIGVRYLWHSFYKNHILIKTPSIKKYVLENAAANLESAKSTLSNNSNLLELLLEVDSPLIDQHLDLFFGTDGFERYYNAQLANNINNLLNYNFSKYESYVLNILGKTTGAENVYHIHKILLGHNEEKYASKVLDFAYQFFDKMKNTQKGTRFEYITHKNNESISLVAYYLDILFQYEEFDKAKYFLSNLIPNFEPMLSSDVQKNLIKHLGKTAIRYLIGSLSAKFETWLRANFQQTLDNLLLIADKKDFETLWKYTRDKNKIYRNMVARFLGVNLGDDAIPNAMELLSDKKGELRQVGALVLTAINSEKAQAILIDTLEKQNNDDVRDAMLEGLTSLLATQSTRKDIEEKVQWAAQRKKLETAIPAWIPENEIPAMYWKENGKKIDNQLVKYLFYRMSRSKDICFDVEAKPFFALIDKTTSGNFAIFILQSYLKSSADAKFKYILTISAALGDDRVITVLQKQVLDWVENARGKMAEYAVKSIALNGSNKAMRVVEFYTRKYKSKQKNIGAAAEQAFVIAAEELGLSPYELADSIIPDFGFTGLFKEFENNGAQYRAFIDNNFKIAILDEDNNLLKKLPKGTSPELETEFKEIGKEIKDIVKSQSSRLEQYLVTQRKWKGEQWIDFFLQKPVMFAYATSLIWGIYDTQNQLISCFQCLEDQSLVNMECDEIEINTNSNIGIVHPLNLEKEEISYWKTSLYEAKLKAIFPQLERSSIEKKEEHLTAKSISDYEGIKVGGYTFVGKMEKTGWSRGSVQDAGSIASFYKNFAEIGITAFVIQVGMIGVGYYEEDAEIGKLYFVKYQSVKIGSYQYDEPNNDNDPRIIPISEVPPIVYSEVMSDMEGLKAIEKKAN